MEIHVLLASGQEEHLRADRVFEENGRLTVVEIAGDEIPGGSQTFRHTEEIPQFSPSGFPMAPLVKTSEYRVLAIYPQGMWMRVSYA